MYILILQMRKEGSERLSDLPKFMPIISGRTSIRMLGPKPGALPPCTTASLRQALPAMLPRDIFLLTLNNFSQRRFFLRSSWF